MNHKGTILHLQRLSTEDGPGLRTTVFFKGCPLRCRWCHNPESLALQSQVQWLENRCIGCGSCQKACPNGALAQGESGWVRDRARCTACGACVEACPANAMEMLGNAVTVESLVAELLKDRAYFGAQGGVTLSGGDPSLQPDFAAAVLGEVRALGVSTALDTCGLCQPETLARLIREADVILYDLKLIDSREHARWTGQPNERILENFRCLAGLLREGDLRRQRLWVRTPLIPGATTGEANIRGIGAFLQQTAGDVIERWELCAFNNLCRDKYRRLGLDWDFADTPLIGREELTEIEAWASSSGMDPALVSVTGAARVEAA